MDHVNTPGSVLFRPRFTRFGQQNKQTWQQQQQKQSGTSKSTSNLTLQPDPTRCLSQRDRIRKELSAVLNLNFQKSPTEVIHSISNSGNFLLGTKRLYSRSEIKSCSSMNDLSDENSCGISKCYRCGQSVYPMEKLEPSAGQRYHPQCFRCVVCHVQLSLSTFCRSLQSVRDTQIYCRPHQPRQDKVMLCNFSTRKSNFPAFKLSWNTQQPKDHDTNNFRHHQPQFGTILSQNT